MNHFCDICNGIRAFTAPDNTGRFQCQACKSKTSPYCKICRTIFSSSLPSFGFSLVTHHCCDTKLNQSTNPIVALKLDPIAYYCNAGIRHQFKPPYTSGYWKVTHKCSCNHFVSIDSNGLVRQFYTAPAAPAMIQQCPACNLMSPKEDTHCMYCLAALSAVGAGGAINITGGNKTALQTPPFCVMKTPSSQLFFCSVRTACIICGEMMFLMKSGSNDYTVNCAKGHDNLIYHRSVQCPSCQQLVRYKVKRNCFTYYVINCKCGESIHTTDDGHQNAVGRWDVGSRWWLQRGASPSPVTAVPTAQPVPAAPVKVQEVDMKSAFEKVHSRLEKLDNNDMDLRNWLNQIEGSLPTNWNVKLMTVAMAAFVFGAVGSFLITFFSMLLRK